MGLGQAGLHRVLKVQDVGAALTGSTCPGPQWITSGQLILGESASWMDGLSDPESCFGVTPGGSSLGLSTESKGSSHRQTLVLAQAIWS